MADFDKLMRFPKELEDGKTYTYAWGTDDTKIMAGMRADGYDVVLASDPTAKKAYPEGHPLRSVDGKIKLGDAVLMRCKTELAQERNEARRRRNRGGVRAVKEDFVSTATSLGVPAFEDATPS